jgi:gluconokinase
VYDFHVVIILMGVQGSGKTTVGLALASRLGWSFADADDFHSEANKKKMSAGIALNDEDRAPWLAALRAEIDRANAEHRHLVMGCSALKQRYRDVLAAPGVKFVYLHGSQELIASRLRLRRHHYAKLDLLPSQFEQLEEPKDALVVEIDKSVEEIVSEIVRKINVR